MKYAVKKEKQKGLTIIELMISLFLGVVLVAFTLPTFMVSLDIYNSSKAVARTDEGARFALTVLAKDIRNAGYRGCDSEGVEFTNNTGSNDYDFSSRLTGMERTSDEAISGVSNSINLKDATDSVTFNSLLNSNGFLSTSNNSSSTDITLNITSDFIAGDIVYIGDCQSSVMMRVVSTSGNTITFSQAPGISFSAGTHVYRFEKTTYFIAASQLYVNNQGNIPNSLWRKINANLSEELVAGIEDLQVSYGVDDDDDGIANQYISAPTAAQYNSITLVRFKVTSTSLDTMDSSGVIEKKFSMSVNLRNG